MRIRFILLILSGLAAVAPRVLHAAERRFGPLHHEFELTLEAGRASETLGPLFGVERKGPQKTRRWTPLISRVDDPVGDFTEIDIAYPLLTYDRFGGEYRFQVMQWLSFSGGGQGVEEESVARKFTLFPFYFQQRSDDTNLNYTAVMPFYGRLKNRFFRSEIKWVMLPLYAQSRKRDIVTDNYLVPFLHLRRGENLRGWQFWPVIGAEKKEPSVKLNDWGDEEQVPGHRKFFALWPFYFNDWTGLGTENPVHQHNILPLVAMERSQTRDQTTVLWPFFTRIDDREKKYREWGAPWPLVVFARGEGKTANRVWPLFSRAHNDYLESRWALWPLYKANLVKPVPEENRFLERRFTRILFFLYQDLRQTDTENGDFMWRKYFWPLFTARRDWTGEERWQFIAPLEPLLRSSDSIERNYSPLWSIWRSEKNPITGARSRSLLWNLWRSETRRDSRKGSIFFGLIQYESGAAGKRWKWFHLFSTGQGGTQSKPARADQPKVDSATAGSESEPASQTSASPDRDAVMATPWRRLKSIFGGAPDGKTNDD